MKVEKNIPLPEKNLNRKYNFHLMDVGDSFYIDLENGQVDRRVLISRVRCAASNYSSPYGNGHGKKFETRVHEKDGKEVIGVWRTK